MDSVYAQSVAKKRNDAVKKSLTDVVPEIYEYWDWDGNNGADPKQFAPYSLTKVKLFCRNHNIRFERRVSKITEKSCRCYCRECTKEKKLREKLDNQKIYRIIDLIPELRDYWPENVNDSKLEDLLSTDRTPVTLYCKKHDHYFYIAPVSIELNKPICPVCAGIIEPVYLFYPEYEKEYSEKNIIPFKEITVSSTIEVIWRCSVPGCECEWVSRIADHINGKARCPNEKLHRNLIKMDPRRK